jgi:hypothetical protein
MKTQPAKGAARYLAAVADDGRKGLVVMVDTEGHKSVIQNCRSFEVAEKAAERWQVKENKAVTKSGAA